MTLNSALLMLLFSPHLEVHEPNENLFYSVKRSLTIKAPITSAADDILNFFFFFFFHFFQRKLVDIMCEASAK